LGEALKHMRQDPLAIVVRRTEPHHAGNVGHDEFGHRLAIDREQTPCIAEQHLAVGGERHRARIARKHRAAENVLQLLDLHGDGRRRAEDRVGGRGEAPGLGNGDKGAQHIEIEQRQGMIERGVHRVRFLQFF
jgi:hypothetical protein